MLWPMDMQNNCICHFHPLETQHATIHVLSLSPSFVVGIKGPQDDRPTLAEVGLPKRATKPTLDSSVSEK